ncbi:glycosyltransferase [Streptomyces abyssalis]|uniref:glycosyltransferase n=1 Tax=Streptomyces abyssalis TaxID=933944 RepID=UPI00085C8DF9|nr:glycosyltransferase [Streptomyces abyssalis]
MKIAFLIHSIYGIGGTIRATANLSSALAARGHEVEVVSVYRGAPSPQLPISGEVGIAPLIDVCKDSAGSERDHELQQQPSALLPEPEGSLRVFTRLSDMRVARYLETTEADVVVATRPGLLVYLAEAGRERDFLRIGQEHMTRTAHAPAVRAALDAVIGDMDAYLTVTEQDAATHRDKLPRLPRVLGCLPNPVHAPRTEPSHGTSRLIVAAGRLDPGKRFDLLIGAFAALADELPDWRVRIYGRGPDHARLRALIDETELTDRVFLMGPRNPIETEWAKASIAVSASDAESFGLTIIEAMHSGVPVVSTDCPVGPREIIDDGRDGLLIPVGDQEALVDALRTLATDPGLRRSLSAAAQETLERHAPRSIAMRFEQVVRELRPELVDGPAATPPAAPAAAAPAAAAPAAAAPEAAAPGTALPGAAAAGPSRGTLREAAARPLRPLRDRLRRKHGPEPTESPEPPEPPELTAEHGPLEPLRPQAHCKVTADGGLLVSIPRTGATGRDLTLVARLRGGDGRPAEERVVVRLEHPESGNGPLTATLRRAEHRLAEGRWDFHVERADDGERARLAAELVEQARLLTLPLTVAPHDEVSAWVPYATAGGALTLRTWLRPAHAELGRVHITPDALVLDATLHGTRATATHLVAQPPGGEPVAFDVSGARFTCTVPYAGLPEHPGTWHLSVRAGDGALIPVGRLAGDNVDRKRTDAFPARTHGNLTVRPVFDPSNNLTLHVEAPEPTVSARPWATAKRSSRLSSAAGPRPRFRA